jgi:hypothetical protein
MRGAYKIAKPAYNALLEANNTTINQYSSLKPKNIQEMIDKVPGTGDRTVRHMLNVGPRNNNEIAILNYYIWNVATPRIRAENDLAKLHSTIKNSIFRSTDDVIDFD